MILDKDGSIVKREFWVEGRKCPLREIRRRKLHDHEKYIRNTTDVDFMNMAFEEVEMKLTSTRFNESSIPRCYVDK